MVAIDNKIALAKLLQPWDLRINSAKQKAYERFWFQGRKKPRRVAGAFLDLYFYYRGLTITKNHFGESFILFIWSGLRVFVWVWGLTCDFAE
jgi:hypothetical protein